MRFFIYVVGFIIEFLQILISGFHLSNIYSMNSVWSKFTDFFNYSLIL